MSLGLKWSYFVKSFRHSRVQLSMRTPSLLPNWKNDTWIKEGLYVLMVMGNEEIELVGIWVFPGFGAMLLVPAHRRHPHGIACRSLRLMKPAFWCLGMTRAWQFSAYGSSSTLSWWNYWPSAASTVMLLISHLPLVGLLALDFTSNCSF